MRAALLVIVAGLAIVSACSDPRVSEDLAAACANKVDDDGDGLVDCDDPDCAGTEACERTTATCENRKDDDRDGTLDCRQESCRALAVCRDAVPFDCNQLPPGAYTGCPLGKGCYVVDNTRWCALEGPALAGGVCGQGDPSDRSQGCAGGYQCAMDGRCARVCRDDYDCTRNSKCLVAGPTRLCTRACLRSSDCRSDEACAPLQRESIVLEQGGWAHRCVPQSRVADGQATEGQPCIDPANDGGGTTVCALGLLCVPEPGGNRCREVCRGSSDGRPSGGGCSAPRLCYPIVPFSGQATSFDEQYAIGVCL